MFREVEILEILFLSIKGGDFNTDEEGLAFIEENREVSVLFLGYLDEFFLEFLCFLILINCLLIYLLSFHIVSLLLIFISIVPDLEDDCHYIQNTDQRAFKGFIIVIFNLNHLINLSLIEINKYFFHSF